MTDERIPSHTHFQMKTKKKKNSVGTAQRIKILFGQKLEIRFLSLHFINKEN